MWAMAHFQPIYPAEILYAQTLVKIIQKMIIETRSNWKKCLQIKAWN